ncbi:MAG: hypothetical protein JST59_00895 [Actinobacteria bacterium]|nr:hypothetical protein [Actinomycetota bacterium]
MEATSKCVISLLHGPHRSNIRRALLLGYQSMCVKVMRINDSLQTLQPSHRMSSLSLRVFEKGDLQHIKRIEPRFYNNYLKAEVAKRENDFNYEFMARLKKLAILTLDLMFEQSVRYQNPAETDEQGKLIESNIVSLYEKLRAVHNVTDEDLIRLLYNKEVEMNFLEKLIALRVFDQHEEEEKEPQLEDLKPSLSL